MDRQFCPHQRRVARKSANAILVERLNSSDTGETFLSSPRLIDTTDPTTFRYPGERSDTEPHDDLRLSELLSDVSSAVDLAWLKRKKIREFSLASDMQIGAYSVYDTLIFEAKDSGRLCILSRGEWFEVALTYVEQVEAQVSALKQHPTLTLPDAMYQEGEGAYNERVASASNGKLFLFDTETVMYGGGYSRIEVCDLFADDGTLVHVKAKTKSATLSHLFVQGVVSAQVLRDRMFRKLAAEKCDEAHAKLLQAADFNPTKFRVNFAIITSSDHSIVDALPFLSKQSLANASRELGLMGYPVSISKILVQAPIGE